MLRQYWKKGQKAVRILKKKGIVGLYYVLHYKMLEVPEFQRQFQKWIVQEEQKAKTQQKEPLIYQPLISIIVPVYNVAQNQLEECIQSVLNQTSENWELCLADDHSTMKEVRKVLKKYEKHPKVKIVYRKENGHISRASNSAIALAEGEYIAFLDCDDILAEDAIYEMTKKLNEGKIYDFVYSDEDKISEDGTLRHTPHFKPDWSPDTLLSHMYTCHFGMYRRSIAEEIGLLRPGLEGAQDYDFTLRFTEKTDRIGHVPKILYHWRERKESTAIDPEAKPYIFEATKKAKEDAMKRRGIKASLEMIEETYQYRILYAAENDLALEPRVSILIITNNSSRLWKCIKDIYANTEYSNFKIIVAGNGSEKEQRCCREMCEKYHCRYVDSKGGEKAEIYNQILGCCYPSEKKQAGDVEAGILAYGDYVLFLDDRAEFRDRRWMHRMLGQAMQKHTGIVGAKIVTADRTQRIISDGLITLAGRPRSIFRGQSDHAAFYFSRNRMDYNYMAVSGMCMMAEKNLLLELGGFDTRFSTYYWDAELCFRIVEQGYYNVVRNDVVMYCENPSPSRKRDSREVAKIKFTAEKLREKEERKLLYQIYPEMRKDMCYNENLAQDRLNCGIRMR